MSGDLIPNSDKRRSSLCSIKAERSQINRYLKHRLGKKYRKKLDFKNSVREKDFYVLYLS